MAEIEVKRRPGQPAAVAPGVEVKRRPGQKGPTLEAASNLPPPDIPMVRGRGLPMELGEVNTGETGKLTDPIRDRQAWRKGQERAGVGQDRLTGRFGDVMDVIGEGIVMNADRPLSGAVSWLSGDGYDYGKAVDAYADEARDARLGGVGTAAEFGGAILSPSPTSKKWLIEALTGGAQAGIEGQNLATEGDQRGIGDIAKDVGIGTSVTGALSGLGRAIKPGELIDTPKIQSDLNKAITDVLAGQKVDRVEPAGLALREALVKEQGDLKTSGRDAMRKAVGGDFAVMDDAGSSFVKDIDKAYSSVSDAPVPITNEGTPAAAALRDSIVQLSGKGDNITLAQIDELRVQARGLRASAANATDKKALGDLEKAIDGMVDAKVAAGAYVGDEGYNKAYRSGRALYEKAMQISDLPKVRQILKDETVPGAAIADSLLSINTSTKSKAPAKLAAVITETLGEGSESLAAVRSGVLATMFEGTSTDPAAQARLLKTLERNETLINELFTPDQVSELASIRVDLTNAANAADKVAARAATEKRVKSFLTKAVQGLGNATKNPGKAGVVTAVASGSTAAGVSVAGLLSAMNVAASRPARAAVGTAAEVGSRATGRAAAQNETIDTVVPNPRDLLIQQLGGQ
jgi:hypothetical protein